MVAETNTPTVTITGNGITTSDPSYTNGIAPTTGVSINDEDQFVPQSQWNRDTLDGSKSNKNPSGIQLNTNYGNIYQISMQYLAFGKVVYSVLIGDNPIDVHVIDFCNASSTRNVKNPNFYFQMYAKNTTSTSTTSVVSANCIGIIQGKQPSYGVHRNYTYMLPFSNNNKLQEDPICIFAIRPTQVFYNATYDEESVNPTASQYSAVTLSLLSLTLGNDEGNAIVVTGRSGKITYDQATTNWKQDDNGTYLHPPTNSVATIFNRQQYTGTKDVIGGGVEHFAIMVAANSAMELDLRKYHIVLGSNTSFAVSAYSPKGKLNGTRWSVAVQWIEEQ